MEIYEEIRANRESGARRMVAEYRARLQGAATMLCKNEHDAEDLVFRAFAQAINRIGDYKPNGSFYYWIYTILLNFHRMDLRKKACRPQTTTMDVLPEVQDERLDPREELNFAATAQAVRAAVRDLPDTFREVVVLKYFENLSDPEISRITGIPEGTVKSRLHHAKDALYVKLCDTEVSPDFTDRLIKATRPFRPGTAKWWTALVLVALGTAALATGTVKVVERVRERRSAPVAHSVPAAKEPARAPAASAPEPGQVNVAAQPVAVTQDAAGKAVSAGLAFLASQQQPNGFFPGPYGDSAAVPALVGMAFLSNGHLPGDAKHGPVINRCIDAVLSCAEMKADAPYRGYMGAAGNGRMYAHSIATLFLSEVSGMVDEACQQRIDATLPLAVKVILDAQNAKKSDPKHVGGWRYTPDAADSDLSCSGWALMALRSCRSNGAQIPKDAIDRAVLFVKRSRVAASGAFAYQPADASNADTLSGAGILCLELCGRHLDEDSLAAAKYLETVYPKTLAGDAPTTFYGLYYTSQALFQLGGKHWRDFGVWMYNTWIPKQGKDGAWRAAGNEAGPAYSTAMTVLALTVPYRMLPIYQRDEGDQ